MGEPAPVPVQDRNPWRDRRRARNRAHRRRRPGLVAASAALACSLAGCAPKADVAFVTNGVASFWTVARAGCIAAGRKFGVVVDVLMPKDAEVQKQMLEDLVTRGIRAIAVSPIDAENQTELIDRLARQTQILTHDSDAPKSKRLCYVGMDNYEAGRLCGRLVREAIPGGGKIMLFIGRLEQDNAKHRRMGVLDAILGRDRDPKRRVPADRVLRAGRYTILGTLTDQFDRAKGKQNAVDTLTKHTDLACMVGLFAYNPPLCLQALEQAGRLGKVAVVAFDEDFATLQGIRDGSVYGTVVQDPYAYGYESVRIMSRLVQGDASALPPGGNLLIPARVIRKDGVDAFWTDLEKKLAAAK